jgi:hypothetical protein
MINLDHRINKNVEEEKKNENPDSQQTPGQGKFLIRFPSFCVCVRVPAFSCLSTLARRLTNHLCVGEEEEFITNWEETVENFDDMGLKEGVLRGIYGYGFVKPSPIQQKGILPVIQGKDTIAQVINIFNNKSKF